MRITHSKFLILKRQASRFKRSSGISHSTALDHIAKEEGFDNWSLLARCVVMPTLKLNSVTLFGCISPKHSSGESKYWSVNIPSIHPEKHYQSMKWMPYRMTAIGGKLDGINERLATARRAIEFMDSTNLVVSQAWTSLIRGLNPKGFDHTCVWRDTDKNIIITTEPYWGVKEKVTALEDWCKKSQWDYVSAPNDCGIWNPCKKDCPAGCMQHTKLFILAPKKKGGNVNKVLQTLLV